MITVLTGAAAIFALTMAAVLAGLRLRTASVWLIFTAGSLAVMFVAFAIAGRERTERCVASLPDRPRFAVVEDAEKYSARIAACHDGEAFGLAEPF